MHQGDRAFDRIAAFAEDLALHRRCIRDSRITQNVADVRRTKRFKAIKPEEDVTVIDES